MTKYEEYKIVGKPDVSDHPYNSTPLDETNDLTKGEYWRFGGASLNQVDQMKSLSLGFLKRFRIDHQTGITNRQRR